MGRTSDARERILTATLCNDPAQLESLWRSSMMLLGLRDGAAA